MNESTYEFNRGEIYLADLEPTFGHEQGGERPVLILQNDVGNYFSPTVIATIATSKRCKKGGQPTHVTLSDVEGLPNEPVFLLEVIRTIDKRRIRHYVGRLTSQQMEKIDAALRISLHLNEDDFLPTEGDAP